MPDFYIKRNDTSPAIEAQLKDGSGTPEDITGFTEIKFIMADDEGAVVVDSDTSSGVTAPNPAEGIVRYAWDSGDTAAAGLYDAEWEVTYSDNSVETFPNATYLEIRVIDDLG